MNHRPRPSRPGPILFCATGLDRTRGGIASANRNVHAALTDLAKATGRGLKTLVLTEAPDPASGYSAFGGGKLAFAAATLACLPFAGLAVFDHVRLAMPLMALPGPLRPPSAIFAHGSESHWRIRPSSARAFAAADLVLANSRHTLGRMAAHVPAFQGVACPLGLAPQFAQTPAPPPLGPTALTLEAADGTRRPLTDRLLLLVSRMDATEREKGHRELLAAMPALVERFPDAQLALVGGGSDLAELRALAAASSVAGAIFLPGALPDETLEALYRQAYAFTMPSRQEGFGLAYLEAMNQAKPCLACRDDGGAEVVADGETGLLVGQPIDPAELLAALTTLLSDPARARRWGEAGWRRLNEHFTTGAHQARVKALIGPLLTGQAWAARGELIHG